MNKKKLHIVIALLLAFATTSSVWGQYVIEQENIEISEKFEKDAEKNEKELEDKLDDGDDFADPHLGSLPEIYSGFLKSGSSTLIPSSLQPKKLYLMHHQLKIHC